MSPREYDGPSLELLVDWLHDAVDENNRSRAESVASELAAAARRYATTGTTRDEEER